MSFLKRGAKCAVKKSVLVKEGLYAISGTGKKYPFDGSRVKLDKVRDPSDERRTLRYVSFVVEG